MILWYASTRYQRIKMNCLMFVAWIIYKSSPAALMLNMKSMLKLFWQFLCSMIDACRSHPATLDQPVRVELNFYRTINSNLNTSVATIVSVGEEPWPIDFPIVDHTIFFLIHFCQLFCAEKRCYGGKNESHPWNTVSLGSHSSGVAAGGNWDGKSIRTKQKRKYEVFPPLFGIGIQRLTRQKRCNRYQTWINGRNTAAQCN